MMLDAFKVEASIDVSKLMTIWVLRLAVVDCEIGEIETIDGAASMELNTIAEMAKTKQDRCIICRLEVFVNCRRSVEKKVFRIKTTNGLQSSGPFLYKDFCNVNVVANDPAGNRIGVG